MDYRQTGFYPKVSKACYSALGFGAPLSEEDERKYVGELQKEINA